MKLHNCCSGYLAKSIIFFMRWTGCSLTLGLYISPAQTGCSSQEWDWEGRNDSGLKNDINYWRIWLIGETLLPLMLANTLNIHAGVWKSCFCLFLSFVIWEVFVMKFQTQNDHWDLFLMLKIAIKKKYRFLSAPQMIPDNYWGLSFWKSTFNQNIYS